MSDDVLSVSGIEKEFAAVRAVRGLSFGVRRGEIFALLGPNGAGKTTTIRMLVGILRPDAGRIEYRLAGGSRTQASDFGYLAEDRGLYPEIPILRTLTYFGVLRGMNRKSAERAARTWLERVGLEDRALDRLETLSKGNQQKVQFVSAILHAPQFAILDEPFSGLDPINQNLFLDVLRELSQRGTTILLSAHQMQLVERVADRILVMSHGEELLHGTMEELRARLGTRQRLLLRVDGSPDLAPLNARPAVIDVVRLATGEIAIDVDERVDLGGLLAEIGSRYVVREVRSEISSLHDIYVRAVETRERAGSLEVR